MTDGNSPSTRTMAIIAIIITIACLVGLWMMGPEPATDDLHGLPSCEEDEYLYPTDGSGHVAYEGPGEADPADYSCFNFDNLPGK
jgi:hypothetical protein